jgi:tRNA-Thr(GGU) m(6)t(6)A37 methyltransferase TsaA
MTITYQPIGYIKSPYKTVEEIPKQSIYSGKKKGIIELSKNYLEGLMGLKKNDHIIILFDFHLSKSYQLTQQKQGDGKLKGVFALRSPHRPNGIGMSIVKLLDINENIITFEGVDMLDNTPVLDIKPYIEDLNPKL